jgi:hypothetical protein
MPYAGTRSSHCVFTASFFNVRFRSLADKPWPAKIEQCPLLSESGQSPYGWMSFPLGRLKGNQDFLKEKTSTAQSL